jgi:hypothetical protein
MEVHGKIHTKVVIDPLDVLENLKRRVVGDRGWVFTKDGRYYRGFETGGGTHSWDDEVEIEKEEHDYVVHLNRVMEYIQQNVER